MAEFAEETHTEFVVLSIRENGRWHWDWSVANSFDGAADPWAYHAETHPEEIVMVLQRRVYVGSWEQR